MRRRKALRLIAGLPLVGAAAGGHARADPALAVAEEPSGPEAATLLVGGPPGGEMDRWGQVVLPALAHALPPGTTVRALRSGGVDGVTAANQFDARVTPDGMTVLLVPGAAALAWLTGDPRAQFDAAHWTSVMAGVSSGIVVGRVSVAELRRAPKLRMAAANRPGPEIAALLALELLGVHVSPVFGLLDSSTTRAAFAEQAVDLVFLRGTGVPAQLAALTSLGGEPLFCFGAVDAEANLTRDPQFPDLPLLVELAGAERGSALQGALYRGWRAAAAAVQLDFGLVLPPVTPAAMVAFWRRAGLEAASSPELQATANTLAVRPLAIADANASIGSVAADQQALLALRQWMAARLNWQPG